VIGTNKWLQWRNGPIDRTWPLYSVATGSIEEPNCTALIHQYRCGALLDSAVSCLTFARPCGGIFSSRSWASVGICARWRACGALPARAELMGKPAAPAGRRSIPVSSENCLSAEQFCRFSPSLPLNLDAILLRRTATENAFPSIARGHGFAKNVEILFAVDAVISG